MEDTGDKVAAAPAGAAQEAAAPAGGAPAEPPSNSALYVGDLDKDLSETDLYDLFNEVRCPAGVRACALACACGRALWCRSADEGFRVARAARSQRRRSASPPAPGVEP